MNLKMVSITVLYEDNHLLVVEKPVNLLSQADRTGDPDMLSLLKADLKQRYNKPGNVYLGLVHRLDRPVGGVMVFAKTSKAAARLSKQIAEGNFQKLYLAVLTGILPRSSGQLVHFLKKDSVRNMITAAHEEVPGSKKAVLEYEVLGCEKDCTLVRVELKTGRPHQIRVQFAKEGFPRGGDRRYGSPGLRHSQIGLWSYQIGFNHPTLRDWCVFTLPPPITKPPWHLFSWNQIGVM